eukprot:jgi/Bigna1/141628/aug1.64_g16336
MGTMMTILDELRLFYRSIFVPLAQGDWCRDDEEEEEEEEKEEEEEEGGGEGVGLELEGKISCESTDRKANIEMVGLIRDHALIHNT